jgi:hypothetical protein
MQLETQSPGPCYALGLRDEISPECPLCIPLHSLPCSDYSDTDTFRSRPLADDDHTTRRFPTHRSPFHRESVARLNAARRRPRIIILIPPIISRRAGDAIAAATDGKIRYKAQPCAPAIKIPALRSDHCAAYVITGRYDLTTTRSRAVHVRPCRVAIEEYKATLSAPGIARFYGANAIGN